MEKCEPCLGGSWAGTVTLGVPISLSNITFAAGSPGTSQYTLAGNPGIPYPLPAPDNSPGASNKPVTLDTTSDPDGKSLFIFRRSDASNTDETTAIAVQYGSDLDGWTTATHQGTAASDITLSEAPDSPGFSQVTVGIPPHLAASGKLFARLKVEVATP